MHRFLGSYLHHDRTCAAVVTLSTQTDFAARTVQAKELADTLASVAAGYGSTSVDDLLRESVHEDGRTLGDEVDRVSRVLGEEVCVHELRVVSVRGKAVKS